MERGPLKETLDRRISYGYNIFYVKLSEKLDMLVCDVVMSSRLVITLERL